MPRPLWVDLKVCQLCMFAWKVDRINNSRGVWMKMRPLRAIIRECYLCVEMLAFIFDARRIIYHLCFSLAALLRHQRRINFRFVSSRVVCTKFHLLLCLQRTDEVTLSKTSFFRPEAETEFFRRGNVPPKVTSGHPLFNKSSMRSDEPELRA